MPPAGPESARSRRNWRGWAALGLTIIAVLPVLVVLVTRTGRSYTPVSDIAPIDLRVRDVWSSHVPLVGAYSRGWNHPGPLMLWLLAIPSGLAAQAACYVQYASSASALYLLNDAASSWLGPLTPGAGIECGPRGELGFAPTDGVFPGIQSLRANGPGA